MTHINTFTAENTGSDTRIASTQWEEGDDNDKLGQGDTEPEQVTDMEQGTDTARKRVAPRYTASR